MTMKRKETGLRRPPKSLSETQPASSVPGMPATS